MSVLKFAVIVEWENALLSDVERAFEMLHRISNQAQHVHQFRGFVLDLILVFDPNHIDASVPQAAIDHCVDPQKWSGTIELMACHASSYYTQKNYASGKTDADFVVFLDSDVVPDDNWLPQLVDVVLEDAAAVVCGETYLSTDTFYERLCAGFWNFDVKRFGVGTYESRNFYANNVIFKREIIQKYPFPDSDAFRGQCASLAIALIKAGVKIRRVRSAAVSHPPPDGMMHLFSRAICEGHDNIVNRRERGRNVFSASPLGSIFRLARYLLKSPVRIWGRRQGAKLGLYGVFCSWTISLVYGFFVFFGEIVSFFSPSALRKFVAI